MDEKTQKEVDAMLTEEREKMVKEMSLVSWFRTWLWLMFAERHTADGWYRPKTRRVRPSLWARLRALVVRPFRAWRVYQYAKLEKAEREKAENAWLNQALVIIRDGGQHVPAKLFGTQGFARSIPSDEPVLNEMPPCCRPGVYVKPLPFTGAVSSLTSELSTEKLVDKMVSEA
jgi:hypothetical protein